MQGNGQFVIRPPNNESPARLQFNEMNDNSVGISATLEDGTAQHLCTFRNGRIILCQLSVEVSKRLGIEIDGCGRILVDTTS